MRRLLRGCEVVPFDEAAAHAAGALLAKTRTKDIVDASVAVLSARVGADVVSDDADDIRRLLTAARVKVAIIAPEQRSKASEEPAAGAKSPRPKKT
jgi:hypothetical protein